MNKFIVNKLKELNLTIAKETKDNFVLLCVYHNEKTPSLFVHKDTGSFNCFGCGEHGTFAKLYHHLTGKKLKHEPQTFKDVIMKFDIKKDKDYEIPNFKLKKLNDRCIDYLENERNLKESIIEDSLVYYIIDEKFNDSYLCFPVMFKKQLVGCELRLYKKSNYLAKSIKYGNLSKYLYDYDDAEKNKEYVIVVEGIFDHLYLKQFGYNVVHIFGDKLYDEQIVKLMKFHKIILMFDGDSEGKENSKRYYDILKQYSDNVINIIPPMFLDPKDLEKEQLEHILRKHI